MYGGLTPRERRRAKRNTNRTFRNQIAPTERACRHCGAVFIADHNSLWLCSDDCRKARDREAHRRYAHKNKKAS